MNRFDYVIVGAGLHGGLLALALLRKRPGVRLALVEQAPLLGGNHTWSFHQQDVPASLHDVVQPLISQSWPAYDIVFPRRQRTLALPYASIKSERFDAVLRSAFTAASQCSLVQAQARHVAAHTVELDTGAILHGTLVLDARSRPNQVGPALYQKFLGLELRLAGAQAPPRPVIMDATVAQRDGFRFLYTLPFAPDHVLVEDTYFSDDASLAPAALQDALLATVASRGMRVQSIVRTETGVLPMPLSGVKPTVEDSPVRIGYGGGWFHPGTGYSFPIAMQMVHALVHGAPDDLQPMRALAVKLRGQCNLAQRLNRMMFHALTPGLRRGVFERFYGLPAATIGRFHALDVSGLDTLRILARPPPGIRLGLAARAWMND